MDEVIEAIEKYQGLVPLVYDIETMVLDEARPQDIPYAVYLKREADKVIAELEESHKKEVGQLLIEIAELKKEKEYVIEHTAEVINAQEREIQRQKYKRYIDIAEWCACKSEHLDQYSRHTDYIPNIEKYKRKRNHYADRCNKLLLLAEKFKEAK